MNTEDQNYNQLIDQAYSDIMDETNRSLDRQIEEYGLERLPSSMWLNLVSEEYGRTMISYNSEDSPEVTLESIGNMVAYGVRLYAELLREATGDAEKEEDRYHE